MADKNPGLSFGEIIMERRESLYLIFNRSMEQAGLDKGFLVEVIELMSSNGT